MRDQKLAELRRLLQGFANTRDTMELLSEHALSTARDLWDSVPHPERDPEVLYEIGCFHWFRACFRPDNEGDEDLEQAIRLLRPFLNTNPSAVPSILRARLLAQRSEELLQTAQTSADLTTLNEAVRAARGAVADTPAGSPLLASRLSGLSTALVSRYDRTGQVSNLEEALHWGRQAVDAASLNDPYHARFLSNLSLHLKKRYDRTEALADLEESVDLGRRALQATPPDHVDRPGMLNNLVGPLVGLYAPTRELSLVDEAIEAGRQAVAAVPANEPKPAGWLLNLSGALLSRYSHTGALADLDEAVAVGRQAAQATPARRLEHAAHVSNLIGALALRYLRLGAMTDLDEAIDIGRQAIQASWPSDPLRATLLANVGQILRVRHERTGALSDLGAAVNLSRMAMQIMADDHAQRAECVSDLSSTLLRRYEVTSNPADLDEALGLAREAVEATPANHPRLASRLFDMGAAVWARYERTGDASDLDEVLRVDRAILDATPQDWDSARRLYSHGLHLLALFERSQARPSLAQAGEAFRAAASVSGAPPLMRALGARGWGSAAALSGEWEVATKAFRLAVDLLAEVAPRSLERRDQENRLSHLAGLGPEAAAACLEAGLVEEAVELFEQGRGVLLAQSLDLRSEISDLTRDCPDLAQRFTAALEALEPRELHLIGERDGAEDPQDQAQAGAAEHERRRAADDALRAVLRDIRQKPGFRRFLLPPSLDELFSAVTDGDVVLVNVTQWRCDALILRAQEPGRVCTVPLPELTAHAIAEGVNEFFAALEDIHRAGGPPSIRAQGEQRLETLLGWLWDVVCSPVLDHLGHAERIAEGLESPRVYWCPSGPLCLLPLHMAGHHGTRINQTPATVLDRVVSSTIPTVRALVDARRPSQASEHNAQVLVVAMPTTPQQPSLPHALDEMRIIESALTGRVDVLGLSEPATHSSVSAELPRHRWVHFACHGAVDLNDPAASHLLFSDHQTRPFTVRDLTRVRLDGELAFLSACTTARPGTALPDEPIHLAAACQLAGYRRVIATLWPIRDDDAVDVAREVYTRVSGGSQPDATGAASGLRLATDRLRSKHPDEPSRWASHIYVGI